MPEQEKEIISEFNAALYQMNRLHVLQTRINDAHVNPLAINMEFGIYNFELILSSCNSLLQEVYPKLKTNEKKDLLNYKKVLEQAMKENPIIETKTKKTHPHTKYQELNQHHWAVLEEWIFTYELKVRQGLEKHGMNSPRKDDSALF